MHIMHTYLIVHDQKPLPDVEKYLGLSSYAILSQSKLPKSRKWQKILIFALFCTIYAHYAYLINHAWTKTSTTCWETIRTTTICNIELLRATKVEKKTNVHYFALFCTVYAHYAYLINHAWTKTSTTCWETIRTTTICNIESIGATKVEKKPNVQCAQFMHIVQDPDFSRKKRPCYRS